MPPNTPKPIISALSLHQPWATLIANGTKKQETRSWPPGKRYIGHDIAIHAAKTRSAEAVADFIFEIGNDLIPLGGVVAIARLRGAWKVSELTATEPLGVPCQAHPTRTPACLAYQGDLSLPDYQPTDDYGDWSEGRWIWELDRVQSIPVIPCKGRQGIWRLPKEIHAELLTLRDQWFREKHEASQPF